MNIGIIIRRVWIGVKLDSLFDKESMDDLMKLVNGYFGTEMRLIRSDMSLFEQYEVRPKKRVFIPKVWEYRIVAKQGKYFFGRV